MGLVDLQEAYRNTEGELRKFLDDKEIFINLEDKKLVYKDKEYCIADTGGDTPIGMIGNKIFYDYSLCGFKYIGNYARYSCIHKYPEIVRDIDRLLELELEDEWEKSNSSYIIKYIISNQELINGKFAEDGFNLLLDVYTTAAYGSEHGEVAITDYDVKIPPENIIFIEKIVSI